MTLCCREWDDCLESCGCVCHMFNMLHIISKIQLGSHMPHRHIVTAACCVGRISKFQWSCADFLWIGTPNVMNEFWLNCVLFKLKMREEDVITNKATACNWMNDTKQGWKCNVCVHSVYNVSVLQTSSWNPAGSSGQLRWKSQLSPRPSQGGKYMLALRKNTTMSKIKPSWGHCFFAGSLGDSGSLGFPLYSVGGN